MIVLHGARPTSLPARPLADGTVVVTEAWSGRVGGVDVYLWAGSMVFFVADE